MFYLKLFGGASIETDGVPLSGTVAQRRRLALLALLAASPPGGISRERLATYLFPEADPSRAHRALSDALHAVRKALGKDAVMSAGDELRLDPSVVRADVAEFQAARAAGDLSQAVSLYRGPFLDGFFVSDAPEFERWVAAERERFARTYAEALEALAKRCEAAGDLLGGVQWLRKLAAQDPFNSRVAAGLMLALERAGDPAGALRHAMTHEVLLREELGVNPPREIEAISARLSAPRNSSPEARRGRSRETAPPEPADAPAPDGDTSGQRYLPVPVQPTDTTAPARRRLTHRRDVAIAVGLVATVALVLIASGIPDGSPAAAPKAGTLVVFPIASQSSGEIANLAQGITDLIARNLDGAGELHVVDPGTVYRRGRQHFSARALDAQRASTLASELGAGRFVTGDLTESGGQVRVRLAVYETQKTGRPVAEATAAGPSGDLFGLADQLTAELLGELVGPASQRVARTAALTSTSLPALKEFLRAERAFRFADYDTAIAGFQRAVSLDSTFALAHYRLAVASGLLDREPSVSYLAIEGAAPSALERALALADRLSERDRQLLQAYSAYRRGAADDAERRYRAILRDYPDDIEARFLLAEVQFRYNALRGRDVAEARVDYEHVLRTDPEFFCPI